MLLFCGTREQTQGYVLTAIQSVGILSVIFLCDVAEHSKCDQEAILW